MNVTLVYGFLGAGKTTLLRRLIPDLAQVGRTAMLVNEFGREGIDQHVLAATGIQVRKLSGGCLCCEIRGDLTTALIQISQDIQPNRLVIEPSGLAAPQMLTHVLASPGIREIAAIDSVITVIDATKHEVTQRAFGDFYADQIRSADVLAINKADIATSAELAVARSAAREINPHAALAVTTHADLDTDLVLTAIAASGRSGPLDVHAHANRFNAELSTLKLERASVSPPNMTRGDLDAWLAALARGDFGDVIRAKGFAQVHHMTVLIDVVMGEVELRPFEPAPARIEIIGRNLEPISMEKQLTNGTTHIPSPTPSYH